MRRHWFPKPYADRVARLRVPGGFLLAVAFLWLSDPTALSIVCGLPVSVLGLWLRGWAAGHLAKNERLTTSGPYVWVRNPLYLGTVLVAAGLLIASRRVSLAVLFAAVFLLVYLPVIELEEQYLRQLFAAFDDYAAQVPMLVPGVGQALGLRRPLRPPSRTRDPGRATGPPHAFSWRLYLYNREYQALAAFLAGVAVLVWKARR